MNIISICMFYKEKTVLGTVFCPACFNDTDNCSCFDEWEYPESPILYRQSDDTLVVEDKVRPGSEVQQTTQFIDQATGMVAGEAAAHDEVSAMDAMNVADLSTFLSRPVRIGNFTWLESDVALNVLQTLSPWQLFFNDSRIKYKLNNFAFIRCNLKVKVVVNASPFYYGCMGMAYQPLPALTPSTIDFTFTQSQNLIPFSQRPIMWIYPQTSEGGEMTLPFFYHKNWLKVGVSQDFADMGTLQFVPFTILQSANGAVGTGCTIQIYAWAEDVQLSGSTLGLALQSQDEYGTGPVSAPASAVAKVAGMLRSVPLLQKFATATEIGARAVSGIAQLFGYTNVPVIENTCPYRPQPFPMLASPEISYPVEKLTLDPKCELALDNSFVGLPGKDELAIDYLVQKESYLTRFAWGTSQNVDDLLFYSRVNPFMFDGTTNIANNEQVDMTPMALVSSLFNDWRGDIIFRFKVIASPYHKGRLLISYDPQGNATDNLITDSNTTSGVYSQIVDIGETDDVEIVVPYQQALPFLQTRQSLATRQFNVTTGAFAFTANDALDNGSLTVKVLTTLTAPLSSSSVWVLCYVKGGDNMEFANPRPPISNLVDFKVQSVDSPVEEVERVVAGKVGALVDTPLYRVNFGECVRSLRPLLHRANMSWLYRNPTTAPNNNMVITRMRFGKLPPYPGFAPAGLHTANKIVGVGTAPYNYTSMLPLHWILPAYIGYRGSGVWTFNVAGNIPLDTMRVSRTPQLDMTFSESTSSITLTSISQAARTSVVNTDSTVGGTALTNQETNAGLSVLCPNYNNYKFNSTRKANVMSAPTSGSTYDGSNYDSYVLEVINHQTALEAQAMAIEHYWNAGPDFNPIFFLNVPSRYIQTSTPSAV